ncbi:F-box/FBD/LRR-repeat protein At2g04230-like [Bidens hawaiensis]|uniref:F-box/FBD/LRR-repeat protein At2g04230-like n=1 Tax=Bidens hawaiensis TaxID=980011 RepID=UPI00404A72DF
MAIKRLREEQETNTARADRLTALPEDLQFRILSSLETEHAFQTSLLSKTWSSKWTYVPVLNFSSYRFRKLNDFNKFVNAALSVPRSALLVKLSFTRGGTCSAKILKTVFDYAFKEGAEELDANIIRARKDTSWPNMSHASWDSLKSLKLGSLEPMCCSFFVGPRSGSFKNLTSLHLKRVIITDLDPFSGFPALKKLKLVCCHLQTDGNTLSVHALHLLELTIVYYNKYVNRCNLTTPNLEYFEFRGNNFPRFEITLGLPVLDTVIIEYNGLCPKLKERTLFDDLMMVFKVLCNVKSLTIYSSVVLLLSLFLKELENRCSPFRDLKTLEVDFSLFYQQKLFEGDCKSLGEAFRDVFDVKRYLLRKSPGAKCTMIYPGAQNAQSLHSPCSNAHKYDCRPFNTIRL